MNIDRAKEILELLADGVNPLTGELLPDSDSCNQVEVVRAFHTALKHLDAASGKTGKAQAKNAGKPWLPEDDKNLCRMFDTGCSPKELCVHFGRSKGAIAARLVRLGKIGERDTFM